MSLPEPLQCLFCNHLNPCGASFCNECGSQLHLQQCDLCGSINKRSAAICYKCGAVFTVAVALAGEPPEIRGERVVGERQTEHLPAEQTVAAEAADPAPMLAASGASHRRAVTLSAIALATLLVAVYYYRVHWLPRLPEPAIEQIARRLSGDSMALGGASSPEAEVDATAGSGGAMKKRALRVFGFDAQRSPAFPDSDAALAKRRPPATDADATRDRAAPQDCPDAVAALGLCNWTQRPERS